MKSTGKHENNDRFIQKKNQKLILASYLCAVLWMPRTSILIQAIALALVTRNWEGVIYASAIEE